MQGGIKTLIIDWDNGDKEKIYGSCLDKIIETVNKGATLPNRVL